MFLVVTRSWLSKSGFARDSHHRVNRIKKLFNTYYYARGHNISTLTGPDLTTGLRFEESRLTVLINVALTPSLLTFTNGKEALYENLLALRKTINRIITIALTNLNEDIFHRLIHSGVVNIATVGGNITTEFFNIH